MPFSRFEQNFGISRICVALFRNTSVFNENNTDQYKSVSKGHCDLYLSYNESYLNIFQQVEIFQKGYCK